MYTYVTVSLILTKCSHATFALSVREDIDASVHVLNSSRVIDERSHKHPIVFDIRLCPYRDNLRGTTTIPLRASRQSCNFYNLRSVNISIESFVRRDCSIIANAFTFLHVIIERGNKCSKCEDIDFLRRRIPTFENLKL